MSFPEIDAEFSGWVAGILLLAGTVSVAGVTEYALSNAGYETLGTVVWTFCYVTALAVIWIVWLRDIDLSGPESG